MVQGISIGPPQRGARLLLCDTDALIQVFIAQLVPSLRELKSSYGIQPTIVPEVEIEVSWNKKFKAQFDPVLRKTISSGVLIVLDKTGLEFCVDAPLVGALSSQIQTLGAEHHKCVGLGEAYAFAAAVTLGQPAISNDFSAVQALTTSGFAVPSPVLRFFDLLVFFYQTGYLTEADCDQVRQTLLKRNEFVPAPFQRASFKNGLTYFCPRLLDKSKSAVGSQSHASSPYEARLLVSPITII